MTLVDWAIVIVIALSVLSGVTHGFLRAVCSLGGLFLGLALAAWNYAALAQLLKPILRIDAVADAVGFLLIAIVVMGAAGMLGKILSETVHGIGLGCLDRIAGAAFGFFQGALLVTLCILVTLAFFPKAHWLAEGKLPKLFFGACHLSTHMTPAELAERIRLGLKTLEEESPRWLHPESGKA